MPKQQLGTVTTNANGFPKVEFTDSYGETASITCSDLIGDYEDSYERPGTSALWLGLGKVEPQILAKDAGAHGVKTQKTSGWVPYPIPQDVLINADMHLNREQVRGLISRLEHWLKHGNF